MSNEKKIVSSEYSKGKYILTFDDSSKIEVDEEIYFKNYIYEKEVLTDSFIDEMIFNTHLQQCYKKALAYLVNGKRTKNRVKAYLLNKGFKEDVVDASLEILVKNNKINDKEFISRFIKTNIKPGTDIKRDRLIAKLIRR
jgi:regulatory protein